MKDNEMKRRSFLKTAAVSAAGLGLLDAGSAFSVSAQKPGAGQGKVPRKELGKTGVKVPILQLGTSQYLNPVHDRTLHYSYQEGINGFDSALSYGKGGSHRAIATFIEQIGDRKKLFITSKSQADDADGIRKDADKCLKQLRTDYLDLYMIHDIYDLDMLDPEYMRMAEKLRKAGKIRFYGFSSHGMEMTEMMQKAAKIGGIDVILFAYNYRKFGDKKLNLAIDACKKAGIGLIAMKTMASIPDNAEKVIQFRSHNFTLPQAKLKSVWADERIDSLFSEMTNLKQIQENVAAAKSEANLTASEVHQLNQLAAQTAHLSCNGCSHICQEVINGQTRIADQLRFLMYHESYGKFEKAREYYNVLAPETREFDRGDIAKAEAVCPQGIRIAERLIKAKHELGDLQPFRA